jgi:hypothetical protein
MNEKTQMSKNNKVGLHVDKYGLMKVVNKDKIKKAYFVKHTTSLKQTEYICD